MADGFDDDIGAVKLNIVSAVLRDRARASTGELRQLLMHFSLRVFDGLAEIGGDAGFGLIRIVGKDATVDAIA
jgi:hypothetical protein